jgi:hypothetical protein
MACYYTGSAEGDAKLARDEATKALTETTELLCGVLKYLDDNDYCGSISESFKEVPGLEEFWKRHKALDEERLSRETEAVLAKLSKKEIDFLKRRGIMK